VTHPASSAPFPLAPSPSGSQLTSWILERRGPKSRVNPDKVNAWTVESEPCAGPDPLQQASIWTLFLTNKECPWRCLMCDLWKHTLDHRTPDGAVGRQIDAAFAEIRSSGYSEVEERWLKLYNSGSFLDPQAIPSTDLPEILKRSSGFDRLILECHPALVSASLQMFLGQFTRSFENSEPPRLEIAMGLETAHPATLARLNKRMTTADFARAADLLRANNVDLRVFLLVHPPFLSRDEAISALHESIRFAFDCGARVVSLIPSRMGNGAMEELHKAGLFQEPSLADLEDASDLGLSMRRGFVFADLWDLVRFSRCGRCFDSRYQRLHEMNLSQQPRPRVNCPDCGGR